MKILVISPLYPPDIGGPATISYELGRRMRDVKVLSFGDGEGMVPRKPVLFRELMLFIKILSLDFDVAYCLDPIAIGIPSAIACILKRKPFVIKFAGDRAWETDRSRGKTNLSLDEYLEKKKNLLRRLQSLSLSLATEIQVASNYFKNVLMKYYGVKEEKIHIIPNAIYDVPVSGSKKYWKEKLGIGEKKVVLSVARLVPWKGLLELASATPKDATLMIIGSGQLKEKLSKFENVVLLGALSNQEVREYMKTCDVFALYSDFESFGIVVAEAMREGAAVIVSDIPALRELIENGKNGIVVPANNPKLLSIAIKKVLSDEHLSSKISKNALKDSELYSWNNFIPKFRKLMEKTVEK